MEHYTLSADNGTSNESTSPQAINVMGMEVDREWFTGLLETLPEDQQRQLSSLLLQTIGDVFPDLTAEMNVTHSDDNGRSSLTDEFSQEEGDEDDEDDNEEEEDDSVEGEEEVESEEFPEEADEEVDDARSYKRRQLSGYLKRFSSPRIKQGLTIWEELSVTLPAFMKDYVMRFAADAGMLVHAAGSVKGGLVTVHILFHLAHHRRAVCRLLDLVLEAEDGTLTERDFKIGGAFAPGEEDQEATPDAAGEIDYDCFGRSSEPRPKPQSARHYVSPRDIAMHGSMNAAMQLVRSRTPKRV